MAEPVATYDPTLATDLDRMRQALGDTDPASPYAPDAEYLAKLTALTDWRLAAAAMARSFAARATLDPSTVNTGTTSLSWASPASSWLKIAAELEAQVARDNAALTGGINAAAPQRADLTTVEAEYSVGLRGWRY